MKHFVILVLLFFSIGVYADDVADGFEAFQKNDFTKAKELFEKACNNGDVNGCNNLGIMYQNGQGTKQDYFKAVSFYEKACSGGNEKGCLNLGFMYENGQGVKKDAFKAVSLYEKACNGGNAKGCLNLGVIYHTSEEIKQDFPYEELMLKVHKKRAQRGTSKDCDDPTNASTYTPDTPEDNKMK